MAVDDDQTINRTKNIIITVTCSQSIIGIWKLITRPKSVLIFDNLLWTNSNQCRTARVYDDSISFFRWWKGEYSNFCIFISMHTRIAAIQWKTFVYTNISHQSQIYIFCSVPFHNNKVTAKTKYIMMNICC